MSILCDIGLTGIDNWITNTNSYSRFTRVIFWSILCLL